MNNREENGFPVDPVELARKIAEGDTLAEDRLFRHLYPRILRQVASVLGHTNSVSKDVAQDCAHQTLELLRANKLDTERGTLGRLVGGIVRNGIRSYFREKSSIDQRYTSIDNALGLLLEELDVEQAFIRKETHALLQTCIKQLPETQRQVVVYKFFHDMKHKAIGAKVDRKEQQVTELFRLAKGKIQKCYTELTREKRGARA